MTKKYKVGDTVYAKTKGKINEIDSGDNYLPYRVKFEGNEIDSWLSEDSIIEPPAKPTLPKDVDDEISFAKSVKGVTFDDYIVRELIRSDYKDSATNKMIQSPDVPNTIEVLLNAWNNGYTTDKPKLYNLIFNDDLNGKIACLFKQPILDELWVAYETSDINLKYDENYQFNQEEIDKYNKDFLIKNIDLNDYKVEVPSDD